MNGGLLSRTRNREPQKNPKSREMERKIEQQLKKNQDWTLPII